MPFSFIYYMSFDATEFKGKSGWRKRGARVGICDQPGKLEANGACFEAGANTNKSAGDRCGRSFGSIGEPVARYRKNGTVVFIYRGSAGAVFLAGDYNRWEPEDKMERAGAGDLWFIEKTFSENARFEPIAGATGAAILTKVSKRFTGRRIEKMKILTIHIRPKHIFPD